MNYYWRHVDQDHFPLSKKPADQYRDIHPAIKAITKEDQLITKLCSALPWESPLTWKVPSEEKKKCVRCEEIPYSKLLYSTSIPNSHMLTLGIEMRFYQTFQSCGRLRGKVSWLRLNLTTMPCRIRLIEYSYSFTSFLSLFLFPESNPFWNYN